MKRCDPDSLECRDVCPGVVLRKNGYENRLVIRGKYGTQGVEVGVWVSASGHSPTRAARFRSSPMWASARRLVDCRLALPSVLWASPFCPTCTSRPSAGVSTATMPLPTSRPPTSLAFWRPAATASSLVAGVVPFALTPATLARSCPMPRPVASSYISMAARACSWRSLPQASAVADPG